MKTFSSKLIAFALGFGLVTATGCDSDGDDSKKSGDSGSPGSGGNGSGNSGSNSGNGSNGDSGPSDDGPSDDGANDDGSNDDSSAEGTGGTTGGGAEAWFCFCAYDCDGVEDLWDADAVCLTEEEAEFVVDIAVETCLEDLSDECIELECGCECEVDPEFVCE